MKTILILIMVSTFFYGTEANNLNHKDLKYFKEKYEKAESQKEKLHFKTIINALEIGIKNENQAKQIKNNKFKIAEAKNDLWQKTHKNNMEKIKLNVNEHFNKIKAKNELIKQNNMKFKFGFEYLIIIPLIIIVFYLLLKRAVSMLRKTS